MTDYWVSHERHFCKYCNVWMQGDKLSVRHHEQGRRHKETVEESFKQKRKAKSDAAASDRELQDQLREIEEAAQAKYAQDLAAKGVPPPPPGGRRAPRPPPRGDRPAFQAGGFKPRHEDKPAPEAEEEADKEEEEDDLGIYQVRGVVYLEGKKHEDHLETGSACQIWVEALEEWLDALVEAAVVFNVPNTDLSFRKFTVVYMPPGEAKPVAETDVLADRLRVPMPAGMSLEAVERMVLNLRGQEGVVKKAPIVVDESTGMGEWSTVEVRQIDESDEAVAKREAEAQAEEERLKEEQKRRDALEDFDAQGDNALGAFNPWGGSYKGVELDQPAASAAHDDDVVALSTKGSVDFKKRGRKANGVEASAGSTSASMKKLKRRRIKSDDE